MDLRALNTFIQVAELGSFSRAAEKLGCSQPTVSFQIKQLEGELGTQLFDRVGHGISLTADGHAALSLAQNICRTAEELLHGSKEQGPPKGLVRLAMADSLCAPLILQHFARFRTMYPDISIKILCTGTEEMLRMLDRNEVDIVCTLENHIYNTSYVLCYEECMAAHFICAPDHPLLQKKHLKVRDVLDEPFLLTEKHMSYRHMMDEELARRSLEITPILELGSADLLCDLVAEGVGISFLPDYVTRTAINAGKVAFLPVEDFKIELWQQILYHRDKWIPAPMRATIDFLSGISL